MKPAVRCLGALASVLWWSPTIAAVVAGVIALAVAQRLRLVGIRYRNRRAARLMDRGRIDEAQRTLRAIRRDFDALDRRRAQAAP